MTTTKPPPPLGLIAIVLVLVGLVLVVGPRDPQPDQGDQVGRSQHDRTDTGPATSSETTGPSTPDDERATARHVEQLKAQQRAVAGFARAFARGGSQERWLAALSGRATPDLLDGFAYTDPRLRPTDPPSQVTYLALGARFRLDFPNGQQMICSVTPGPDDTWLVNSIEPVRTVPTGSDV